MPDPDLTPTDEQVRRLLAEARLVEPTPDDVVDRLDRVLADLGSEAPAGQPPPTDLAARRRRRTARNLLVAAAAVVVLGVGVSQVGLGSSDDGGGSSADSSVSRESTSQDGGAGAGKSSLAALPLVLSAADFDREVRALARNDAGVPQDDAGGDSESACGDPAWGTGERVPVQYDGQPGVLILRVPSGGTREADLYLCGDTAPTRSTTVPAG